ncbi:hypothetical protein G3578_18385 [Brevibacillus sp. SYP-B805]|uniref:hypothetical protein n=1 Tax=Brevibacillus sp. SYP-B805 TaxID=1578199 RepID=UPI0013EAD7CE|nr:hypothetical protein [Brevibacillus sp. SYP-B805]NGQ97111.1 hypothetical protein [Brevibacillus sp. SYP-B805]
MERVTRCQGQLHIHPEAYVKLAKASIAKHVRAMSRSRCKAVVSVRAACHTLFSFFTGVSDRLKA